MEQCSNSISWMGLIAVSIWLWGIIFNIGNSRVVILFVLNFTPLIKTVKPLEKEVGFSFSDINDF